MGRWERVVSRGILRRSGCSEGRGRTGVAKVVPLLRCAGLRRKGVCAGRCGEARAGARCTSCEAVVLGLLLLQLLLMLLLQWLLLIRLLLQLLLKGLRGKGVSASSCG